MADTTYDYNFLDYEGTRYLKEKIDELTDTKIAVETTRATKAESQLQSQINTLDSNKVDKINGKGLSTNDYTTEEKNKLANIEEGANAYVHPNSGVTAGTYRNVIVDKKGHVTGGSNPTTTVAQGGTGLTNLTSGYALVGNGNNAVSLRGIDSSNTIGALGYSGVNTSYLTTMSTLAFWDGAYTGTISNLAYCKLGAFGVAATKGVDTTATNGSGNLITSGAIHTALEKKQDKVTKKYIIIGDSYGVGYTPDGDVTSWCTFLKERLGVADANYIVQVQNGAGFAVTGNLFLSLLNKVSSDNSVTDIIVAGGFNDIDKGYDAINNAIATFKAQAKTKFPNAELKIAYIGGTKNSNMIHGSAVALDNYYKACIVNGVTSLKGCEYSLRRYNEVFSSDGFHPNVLGQQYIADYLFNALNGHPNSCYIQYVTTNVEASKYITYVAGGGIGAMIDNGTLHGSCLYPIITSLNNVNIGLANGSNALHMFNITGGLFYGNTYNNIAIPVTAVVRNSGVNLNVSGTIVIANSGIAFYPFAVGEDQGYVNLSSVEAVQIPQFSFCADALMC